MKPLTSKDMTFLVSKKLGIPQSDVNTIIKAYYKPVRKDLTSLNHIHVNVPSLGLFTVMSRKLDKLIRKRENILALITSKERQSMTRYETKIKHKAELEVMRNVRQALIDEKEERREFRINKYDNSKIKS